MAMVMVCICYVAWLTRRHWFENVYFVGRYVLWVEEVCMYVILSSLVFSSW